MFYKKINKKNNQNKQLTIIILTALNRYQTFSISGESNNALQSRN